MALLDVFLDVGIHPRPVVALENPFSGFGNAVVTAERGSVRLCQYLWDEPPRQEYDSSVWVVVPADAFPDEAVFDEAVLSGLFDGVPEGRILREFLTCEEPFDPADSVVPGRKVL